MKKTRTCCDVEGSEAIGLSSVPKTLVLDDVSGPEAAILMAATQQSSNSEGAIARLSREAIHYAASLPVTDPRLLSARIYRYNTAPLTAETQANFGDPAQTAGLLGLAGASPLLSAIARSGYERVEHEQWLTWTRRGYLGPETAGSLRYKLYVSPVVNVLPEVVERALKIAIDLEVPSFKIGNSAANLLRPDKFIFSLDSAETLNALSAQLQRELAEYPAQGVPFTRMLDRAGIVSAGDDPPRSLCIPGWGQAESRRGWIADRLALALLQARSFANLQIRCEFVLTKLSIEGIDTRDWALTSQVWQGEIA